MRIVRLITKFKIMEEKRVKKLALVLTLTLVLVSAFSAVALGAAKSPIQQIPTLDRTGVGAPANAHEGFTVNGDTCSSCHSMHYAGNGVNLTLQTNPALACLTCHDGTTANYDVLKGQNEAKASAMGGLFANYPIDTTSTASGSMHDVFSGVQAYTSAPGGRGSTPDKVGNTPGYDNGTWAALADGTTNLTCSSCHNAHSSVNPRLLSTNPNGIMDDPAVQQKGVAALTTTGGTVAATFDGNANTKYWFPTAPASDIEVYVDGKALKYVADYQIKWESFDSAQNTKNDAGSSLTSAARGPKPGYMSVFKEDHAYVVITNTTLAVGKAVTLDYKPALVVQMKINNYNAVDEWIQYGKGVENFCTACHTDFKGSKSSAGVFSGLNHHTGNRPNEGISVLGNYVPESKALTNGVVDTAKESIGSCLTCHFAHGTNQARWAEASISDPDGTKYLDASGNPLYDVKEEAGKSVNKRLPNNAMCVLCHDMVATNGSGTSKN